MAESTTNLTAAPESTRLFHTENQVPLSRHDVVFYGSTSTKSIDNLQPVEETCVLDDDNDSGLPEPKTGCKIASSLLLAVALVAFFGSNHRNGLASKQWLGNHFHETSADFEILSDSSAGPLSRTELSTNTVLMKAVTNNLVEKTAVSTIPVPFRVNLKAIETYADNHLPATLVSSELPRTNCYKSKWFTIPCTPTVEAGKNGHLQVFGSTDSSGNDILVTKLPIWLKVRGKAKLGSATATADATMSIKASADIDENWNPVLKVQSAYEWSSRPKVSLFHLIDIDVTSKVEPKFKEAIATETAKLPSYVSRFKVREKMEKLWHDMQQPVALHYQPNTFLLMDPISATFSGLTISHDTVSGVLGLLAKAKVLVGEEADRPAGDLAPLPGLVKKKPPTDEFNINMPVTLTYAEMIRAANTLYPNGYEIEMNGTLTGKLLLTEPRLKKCSSDSSGLCLTVHLKSDDLSVDGEVTFEVTPKLVADLGKVSVESVAVLKSATNNGMVNQLLPHLPEWTQVEEKIQNLAVYDYNDDALRVQNSANEVLNRNLSDLTRIEGKVEYVNAESLLVDEDAVTVGLLFTGKVSLEIDFW